MTEIVLMPLTAKEGVPIREKIGMFLDSLEELSESVENLNKDIK